MDYNVKEIKQIIVETIKYFNVDDYNNDDIDIIVDLVKERI